MSQSMRHHPGGPRGALAPILLRGWIRRAIAASFTKEEYLERAVAVALRLVDCLLAETNDAPCCVEIFGPRPDSWADLAGVRPDLSASPPEDEKKAGEPSKEIDDIVPENVLVHVACDFAHSISHDDFMETGVSIRTGSRAPNRSPEASTRDFCFALGTILFELFSRGDPLLVIEGKRTTPDLDSEKKEEGLFRDWLLLEDICLDGHGPVPPASKRSNSSSAAAGRSAPTSTKAKFHLQEQGMPLSVCQLVSDLLENERGNQFVSGTAVRSLEEAQFDLRRMKTHPQRFLHDRTSPEKALADTALFNQTDNELYGRDREMKALMDVARRVALRVLTHSYADSGTNKWGQDYGATGEDDFLCEAAFLSGPSGSGKSSLVRRLSSSCGADDWLVLICKFDRQVAPLSALLHSIDSLFGSFVPRCADGADFPRQAGEQATFDRVSASIIASIDSEGLAQLCVLLPNLSVLFPMSKHYIDQKASLTVSSVQELRDLTDTMNNSSSGTMGSGRNRLNYLLHLIFKALCSSGRPLLICLDDIQWGGAALDLFSDFILSMGHGSVHSVNGQPLRGGLLYVGNFRDNEVDEDGLVMSQIKSMEQFQRNINVTRITMGEIPETDVNKMLSFKLCLPARHTRELAQIVHQKTRGYPMFTIEFLRSIIRKHVLAFSVRDRRWVWDETSVDMQPISEGVAGLLTRKLRRLPGDVVQTLMVMSCLGNQASLAAIQLLDLGEFVPDMMRAVDEATREGIVERAGPIFAFSHDMLQETSYGLIPVCERAPLHKSIALSLAQRPDVASDSELCTLTVDQMNICKDFDGILDPMERARFARLNLAAGKHSMRSSSYEQAWAYFEAGISLLHANHWNKQYHTSLQLYEYSVVVSFMDGNFESVLRRSNDILSNAKSFDDKLSARTMLAKLFVSQERYTDGFNEIIEILSGLGEEFPKEVDETDAAREILATLPLLDGITEEKVRGLPVMQDQRKLNAMKFLSLLSTFCTFHSPTFVHLLSSRMIQLTFRFGFCEDAIAGLTAFSHGLWICSNNIDMSKRIHEIAQALIRENANEHALRARLIMISTTVICVSEPGQAVAEGIFNAYKSAIILGDVDNAMNCGLVYCICSFLCTAQLIGLQRKIVKFLHEMARHKRIGLLRSTMSFYSGCVALIGSKDSCGVDSGIEMKTITELYQIAERTQNTYLLHHVIMSQMYIHCFFRRYLSVTKFAEKYEMKHAAKRITDFALEFFGGISALALARDTKQEKWRKIGEKSVQSLERLAVYGTWNFENKLFLLQAELHYLNKHHKMAEHFYEAAIASAHEHKFIHEEALAQELYGIYFVENKRFAKGMEQLLLAKDKYRQWGAIKKADDVQNFIELIQQ